MGVTKSITVATSCPYLTNVLLKLVQSLISTPCTSLYEPQGGTFLGTVNRLCRDLGACMSSRNNLENQVLRDFGGFGSKLSTTTLAFCFNTIDLCVSGRRGAQYPLCIKT